MTEEGVMDGRGWEWRREGGTKGGMGIGRREEGGERQERNRRETRGGEGVGTHRSCRLCPWGPRPSTARGRSSDNHSCQTSPGAPEGEGGEEGVEVTTPPTVATDSRLDRPHPLSPVCLQIGSLYIYKSPAYSEADAHGTWDSGASDHPTEISSVIHVLVAHGHLSVVIS